MRTYLFVAFLGVWVAVVPFLPISCGSTQKATLLASGLVIVAISFWSLRRSQAN